MIITTTQSIERHTVVKYFRPINVSLVAGTDIGADIVASFSDVFGGISKTYSAHLSDLFDDALKVMEQAAKRVGANAVIGARFDVDPVEGKGTQMFMMNAVGTPVQIMTADELSAYEEHEKREAAEAAEKLEAGKQRFADISSALGLLDDPEIAAKARELRRIYGRGVCASFLNERAQALGLTDITITEDDIPDTF